MMKIKRLNDNKVRLVMSNGNIMELKYKSELLDRIRGDLIAIENESSDCNQESFTEDDVWSLYEFLLMRHKNDWVVIDEKRRSIFMRRNILSMMNMKIKLTYEYEEAV